MDLSPKWAFLAVPFSIKQSEHEAQRISFQATEPSPLMLESVSLLMCELFCKKDAGRKINRRARDTDVKQPASRQNTQIKGGENAQFAEKLTVATHYLERLRLEGI